MKNSTLDRSWKNWLSWLASPVFIGFALTALSVALAFQYYNRSARTDGSDSGVLGLIQKAHLTSIDYRLRLRGPRPVSSNLAMLAVDERALETIGRWPWSRDVLAKALENALQYKPKALAFDIVFSEPQLNPADTVLEKIKAAGADRPDIEQSLAQVKDKLDADLVLGSTFAKYADHIVAGSLYAGSYESAPETEFCREMIYKRTQAAKQWDKEEVLLSITDPYLPYMPTALTELFSGVLQERENSMREKLGAPKNRNEEVAIEAKINADLHEACSSILDSFREELNQNWAEILKQENPKEFTFPNYDAWLNDYVQKSKPNSVPVADLWRLNTPAVAQGTKHTAYFNTEQDADGTIRSKALIVRTGNSYFPALSLKAYLVANNYNAAPRLDFNPATGTKEVVDMEITNNDSGDTVFHMPVDAHGRLLINYAGPEKMYPYLSFADLVSDSPEAEIEQRVLEPKTGQWEVRKSKVNKADFIKDKIFVVGATAIGIYDLRVTPFEKNYPGAETHLNAIDNMIQRNFYRYFPDEQVYMPLILGAIGVVLSIALAYLGALPGLALTLAFLLAIAFIDKTFLFGKGYVVTIVWPLFLVALLYTGLTFWRYLTEERGKKELRQTFQKYVSPAIVEEILSHPKNIELGGKKMNLTVMFSDVRGFTTISEKLDPRALSDLLNSYLTPMTEIVFKNQGTLDKYMGDAIMAFFGAPIAYKDHAKHACRCALQSVQKLEELQKEYERKGLPMIDIGIGLNSGEVSVGNMGSQTVRSYTVMGDAVNLASRLEGINKQYGTRIILSEMTYAEVKDNFICREVDWVRVKGKVLPVKIYELIAEEKVSEAKVIEMLKWFEEGYNNYHAKAWSKGLDCFSKALDLNPRDEVSKLYVERCRDYLHQPPEDGWDGVFVMKTK